jgi:hypothetical protein
MQKTVTALWRGLEAALLAAIGYLGATYVGLDEQTGSSFVDMLESSYDKAIGVAIVTFLLGFGLTRGPVRNISRVAGPPEKESVEVDVDPPPPVDGLGNPKPELKP